MNTTSSPPEPNLMAHPRGHRARRPVLPSGVLIATAALLLHAAASGHAIAPVPDGNIAGGGEERVEAGTADGEFACFEAPDTGAGLLPALHDIAEVSGLVALEYVVPADAWGFADPPQLFGHDFRLHPDLPQWSLHAWIWTADPYDVVPDYHPEVRLCQFGEQRARQAPGEERETSPGPVLPADGREVPR